MPPAKNTEQKNKNNRKKNDCIGHLTQTAAAAFGPDFDMSIDVKVRHGETVNALRPHQPNADANSTPIAFLTLDTVKRRMKSGVALDKTSDADQLPSSIVTASVISLLTLRCQLWSRLCKRRVDEGLASE
ncbi:hypothetical protein Efla_007630 [Eimeria flavescens]